MCLRLCLALLAGGFFLVPSVGLAGKGCCRPYEMQRTLVEDFRKAGVLLVGTFNNAREGVPLDGPAENLVDLDIERVLKDQGIVAGTKKLTVPMGIDPRGLKFVVFAEVKKGSLDIFRIEVASKDGDLVRYLQGAIELHDRTPAERLAYALPHVDSKDDTICNDAYREFATADLKDLRTVGSKTDPRVLIARLKDPKTPAWQFGLYATLLGHCGKAEHGRFLERLIEDRVRHNGYGQHSMLAAYVMLEPDRGWRYLERNVLAHANKSDFHTFYAGLRCLRYLWAQEPDVVGRDRLARAALALAESPEVADFAIDDLRQWKRWEATDAVISLAGRTSHGHGVIQRAALGFSLQSPTVNAAVYVAHRRDLDPDEVEAMRDALKLESAPPPPSIRD